jgi:hypothetical protein
MKKIVIVAGLLLSGCSTTTVEAVKTLRAAGFTDIETVGIAVAACGEGDKPAGRKFVAINPSGQSVDGVVCCGMGFKGCTIRF